MKFQTLVDQYQNNAMSPEEVEAQKELRAQAAGLDFPAGIIRPWFDAERRDMTATGTTSVSGDQGGMTIPHVIPEIGTSLQNKLVLIPLGARVLVGAKSNVGLPRADVGVQAVWLTENAAATDGSETFALLDLTPKRILATRTVSDQWLMQTENAEAYLMNEAMNAISAEIERVAINGSGTSPEPRGILNTSGIGSVVGGTNGLAPTNGNLADIEFAVTGTQKADRGKCAWLVSPAIRKKLRGTFVNGTGSDPVWSQDEAYSLFGHPAGVTPNVPDNLTKGTSSGVCSAIAFGEFSELFIVFFGPGLAFEIVRSKASAISGQSTVIVSGYVDVGLRTPKAFAAMKDALAA